MKIYIGKNGEQQGPYSIEEVNALAQSATITGDDVCWFFVEAPWHAAVAARAASFASG